MRTFIRIYHLFFGLLALGTLLFDFLITDNIINLLSFFTIQSNLMAASVFLYLGIRSIDDNKEHAYINSKRGAIVVYMTVTGVVYALLLQNLVTDNAYPWISFVLHNIMPVTVAASWLLYPPTQKLGFRNSFMWLWLPVIMIAARPSFAKDAKLCGADYFLAKPFDIDVLLEKIESFSNPDQSKP